MMQIDHLVVGSADLDTGIAWVAERLGVEPVFGGVHDGFGTRNALLGLGDQYLEVLAHDPAQSTGIGDLAAQVAMMDEPRLYTLAVRTTLRSGHAMSRVRPDGVRLEWRLRFTQTPLFFIDWLGSPHPSERLPDGGRITSVAITTPEPAELDDVDRVTVREGAWRVNATINDLDLA